MNNEELRNAASVMLAAAESKPIEYRRRTTHSKWQKFDEGESPSWLWEDVDYRVAVTKPSIDWSHVHPDFVAMATDENGCTYLYVDKPVQRKSDWGSNGIFLPSKGFASFTPGTCDWKDSLVLRPTKEQSE